jgi:hypothetical protein
MLPGLRPRTTFHHFAWPDGPTTRDARQDYMEPAAIFTFALIGGFVWGGFLVILRLAVRKEREKGAR